RALLGAFRGRATQARRARRESRIRRWRAKRRRRKGAHPGHVRPQTRPPRLRAGLSRGLVRRQRSEGLKVEGRRSLRAWGDCTAYRWPRASPRAWFGRDARTFRKVFG